MKKILFLSLCFLFGTAQAQTVEEIIQRHSDSLGGLAAFNAVKTMKIEGTSSVQGLTMPLTFYVINGKAMRSDVEAMGQKIINVYKDGKAWGINPLAGSTSPEDLTGSELYDLKDETMMAGPLMDYKALGNQVSLEGKENVEGTDCYKIKLTRKEDGKVSHYFISTADYKLLKIISPKEIMGQDVEIESYLSNYKDFNGLKYSMNQTQKLMGQVFQELTFSDIQLNVSIDEKIFDKPN